MKEAIVSKGTKVTIIDSEIPKPGPRQVVIKVEYSGSNPKDWKLPEWMDSKSNQGDDIAGTVHEVGNDVVNFKPGDKVFAFHQMLTPGGSYAEYALSHETTTAIIPKNTSFEEAATIPLAALTAVVGLYETKNLGLPEPWDPATQEIPLLIYGGASAVGAFAIQLAKRSNIHPIIAVAGNGIPFVEKLLDASKGDKVVDYRGGDDAVVSGIKAALNGKKLFHAYDAVSEKGSFQNISKVLEPKGKIGLVLPGLDYSAIPDHIIKCAISVGDVHSDAYRLFGYVHTQNLAKGLQEGWFKGHPYEVVKGGLAGVEEGLCNLKEGKASAKKYIFKIADTPNL